MLTSKIESPWWVHAAYVAVVLAIFGALLWSVYYRFDGAVVQRFVSADANMSAALELQSEGVWSLTVAGKPWGVLSMESNAPGSYRFRVEKAAHAPLPVGAGFELRGAVGTSAGVLVCQQCVLLKPGYKLPGAWILDER